MARKPRKPPQPKLKQLDIDEYLAENGARGLETFKSVYFKLPESERREVAAIVITFCERVPGMGVRSAIELYEQLAKHLARYPLVRAVP